MLHSAFGDIKLSQNLIIALKNFYSIPTLLLFGLIVNGSLLNMSESMLNNTRKCMLGNGFCVLGSVNSSLGSFHNAGSL